MDAPQRADAAAGIREHSERSRTVVWAALAGNLAIAVAKIIAAVFTGSSAMWSEAVHSLVDTGNQWLMLLGMKRASKPPSEAHPFGHGLELYFWSFVVAIMIFGLGAGVSVYQGVAKVLHPQPLQHPVVNYLVLGVSALFEGTVWLFALREFRRKHRRSGWIKAIRSSKDPTVFTVLFEDTAALTGLCVALVGVGLTHWTNDPVYDSASSIVIGIRWRGAPRPSYGRSGHRAGAPCALRADRRPFCRHQGASAPDYALRSARRAARCKRQIR